MTQIEEKLFSVIGLAAMTEEETQRFHEELGKRIARRRKELGLTQIELAERIEATQKIVTSYERATRQMPAWRLPMIAEALETTPEALLGVSQQQQRRGRGRESRLEQQLERLKELPRSEQQFVMKMLDTALAHAH
ncbi:MAG: helix-turn-helix transcriptional regulator [Sedimentisphaerales bacterium]|nr:helix-turn-helix transcriptional regulator [Sedimentisphaerales bacterium]